MTKFHPPYSISGEQGKGLGMQRRELTGIGAELPRLSLRSLAADELTWVADGGAPGPSDGERVSLWDGGGRRVFSGTAKVRKGFSGGALAQTVTVSGPYLWMLRTKVATTATEDGVQVERPFISFPAGQDGRTSIQELLARAAAQGAPFVAGDVAAMFPGVLSEFRGATFDDVLADLLRLPTDAATWMEYDTQGPPRLHVVRRKDLPAHVIELGAGGNLCEGVDLEALPELRPEQVVVYRVARDAQRQPYWVEERAGNLQAEAGKQAVVVSGLETDADFPAEYYDEHIATTMPAGDSTMIRTLDSGLAGIHAQYGSVPGQVGSVIPLWTGTFKGSSISDDITLPALAMFDEGGTPISPVAYNVLTTTTSPPEWLVAALSLKPITISGSWWHKFTYPNGTSPEFTDAFRAMAQTLADKAYWATEPSSEDTSRAWPGWRSFEVKAWYAPTSMASTVVLRVPSFDDINPPVGLAQNLYDAQNWLPYKGSASFLPGQPVPQIGAGVNVRGGFDEWRYAKAPINGIELDLTLGTQTWTLGPPPRLGIVDLTDRFGRGR